MTHPTADPLIGRTVAHYEIVSRLGGGGMGVVYRAIDRKLDRPVAVKFLPPQWSHDDTAKQRFIREAQAASATHHPNICTIHDVETADDGQLFIVMAYYEGPTLKQRLAGGPLPIDEALDIATQLADGLAKAHAQGVVHRDIKPGNLILTEDGVRIVDFGLATFADALQLTTTGSTLGTAAYMSPEQSKGQEADARTDVWAAGVVLYEMLAGHVPFRGAYAEAITYAIRNDPPPPLRTARPEIPEEVEQLVFRALHKDPAIRFQSGRELARALRQVRGFTVPQDLRTQVVQPPAAATRPARPRRRRWLAAAVAVVAVLVGTPAWLLMPIEREAVAVTPLVDRTGFPELAGLEFALQEELTAALADSRVVRAASGHRLREILAGFRVRKEATGPDALQAVRESASAAVLLVPRLANENGLVTGYVDVVPRGGVREATVSAGPVASALHHRTAQALVLQLSNEIDAYFASRGPVRGRVVRQIEAWLTGDAPRPRFAALTAAAAFERGLDAHDRFEYAAALAAFSDAAREDPRSALALGWRSRTALLMRRAADAADAADRAGVLLAGSGVERTFLDAVVAEGQRRYDAADASYQALVDGDPRNAAFLLELGGYLDRRGRDEEAANAYLRALALDPALARPDLELCRLYGSTRLNDAALARKHGDAAQLKYRRLGFDAGVAQAAMCLADVLRIASPRDAAASAADARRLLEATSPYQVPRAVYYQALAALAQDDFQASLAFNQDALAAADRGGNTAIQPFILQSLSAVHSRLGNRRLVIEYTRKAAAQFAALGDDARAATLQTNAASTLIDSGDSPDEAYTLVQNALRVFQKARDSAGEVLALAVSARYHQYAGRHLTALELAGQALAISRQAALKQYLSSLQVDQSRSHFELGDYAAARALVADGGGTLAGRARVQADIWLAQIDARLGEFDRARATLASAAARTTPDRNMTLLLEAARGELAYEEGRIDGARGHFAAAARFADDDLPHPRSLDALVYAGGLDTDPVRGAATLRRALDRATQIGRRAVEARARVFLAKLAVSQRRAGDALRVLQDVPADDDAHTIGPELRALVHYWTAQALEQQADRRGAEAARRAAREALDPLRARLDEDARRRFDQRADIRRIVG